jgi:hypothetical protein
MSDAGFPLPSSSYRELIKIVQGYERVGTDASLADVAQLTAIGETIISGNNRFLIAVGIVQGGKKKSITPLGAELAIALQHELPDEIAAKWRAVVEANDFLQKVVASVRIRKGMDESSLESHVAYSAGQPKTPAVTTGAGTVVEILKNAGLLKEEGGNLVATAPEPPSIPETVQKSLSISDSASMSDGVQVLAHGSEIRATTRLGGVELRIDVTVQCTPKDLDDLGHKLRKVIQDFNEPAGPPKKPEATAPPGPATTESAEG